MHKNMHACSTRDHTRKYLIPARPDPFEFRTRPTLPVQILNPPDPPRSSKNLPEPSPPRAGRVGSGCSTLIWIMVACLTLTPDTV